MRAKSAKGQWRRRQTACLLILTALFVGILAFSTYTRFLSAIHQLPTTRHTAHYIRVDDGRSRLEQGDHNATSSGCPALSIDSLGFDYPELKSLKAMLPDIVCRPGLDKIATRTSYQNALSLSSSSDAPSSSHRLQSFLQQALALIKAHGQLRACALDQSLLTAWGQPPYPHPGRAMLWKAASHVPLSEAHANATENTQSHAAVDPRPFPYRPQFSARHRRPQQQLDLLETHLDISDQLSPSSAAAHGMLVHPDTSSTSSSSGSSGRTTNGSAAASNSTSSTISKPSSYTYLFAANAHNSGHTMPNMILQLLQLAVVLPPGTLAISIYESGSSDLTRYWLNLLHLLLLPLRTPHYIVTGGLLKPQEGLDRITRMAALRNAALQPFLSSSAVATTSNPRWGDASAGGSRRRRRRQSRKGRAGAGRSSSSSAQVMRAYMDQAFRPAYVVFANDVFLCARDVLRLVSHQADITCGMDFYSAPWDATAPNTNTATATSSSSSGGPNSGVGLNAEGAQTGRRLQSTSRGFLRHSRRAKHSGRPGGGREQGKLWQQDGDPSWISDLPRAPWGVRDPGARGAAASAYGVIRKPSGQQPRVQEQQQHGFGSVWGKVLRYWVISRRWMQEAAAGDAAGPGADREPSGGYARQLQGGPAIPTAGPELRFYDKWVARDINGSRLSNTHPYLHHPPTQQQLLSGYPVPVYCCWNGLAVLRAEPLNHGLQFRKHQPGECKASECSLLCDDYHRLGFSHVVMDPGVQLAYDFDQVKLLDWPNRSGFLQMKPIEAAGGGTAHGRDLFAAQAALQRGDAAALGPVSGTARQEGRGRYVADMDSERSVGHGSSWPIGSAFRTSRLSPLSAFSQLTGAGVMAEHVVGPGSGTAGDVSVARSLQKDARVMASSSSSRVIPFLPWEEVASASAALREQYSRYRGDHQQRGVAAREVSVECCDLQPGENFVNFTADCHQVDAFAVNYTAVALVDE